MSDWKLIHPENVTASSTSLATHGWVLGEIRADSQGRLYRCIKNAEGSTAFSNGLVICWKDQTTFNGECILGDNDAKYDVAGVAVGAIAAASYGWIQISGHHNAIVCDPENGTDVTAGAGLITYTNAGKAQGADYTVLTNVAAVFAIAQEATTTGTAETVSGFIVGRI